MKTVQSRGALENVTGPGGRDGYIHIWGCRELLRMDEMEISEVAIRVKDFYKVNAFHPKDGKSPSTEVSKQRTPIFEVHSWRKIVSFFTNIARMIDIMTFFIKNHADRDRF